MYCKPFREKKRSVPEVDWTAMTIWGAGDRMQLLGDFLVRAGLKIVRGDRKGVVRRGSLITRSHPPLVKEDFIIHDVCGSV